MGQGSPCVFHLLPIGPPSPPTRCSDRNVTYSTVKVGKIIQTVPVMSQFILAIPVISSESKFFCHFVFFSSKSYHVFLQLKPIQCFPTY